MKRKGSVLLLLLLIISVISPAASAAPGDSYNSGTYLVTGESGLQLYAQPEASVDFLTTARQGAYLTVINISDGFGYTVYDSIYGYIDLSSGCEYVSEMPSITASGRIEGVKGIELQSLPDKLFYIEGEEAADPEGLEVALIFDDEQETRMRVTGYSIIFPTLDVYGVKTATVHYAGFSASFSFTVLKVPVTGIVITIPTKTSYVEGEAISLSGLSVTAYFSDGRDGGAGLLLSPDEYTVSGVTEGSTTLPPGNHTVTVTYKYPEISASFHIYVSGKSVTSLRLTSIPANPTLYQGQTFNNEDFTLLATYDNGVTEEITDFDIEYNNMTVGQFTARIYYMDRYVAFDYRVLELLETGIALGDTGNIGSYAGSPLSFRNLAVYITYNSGDRVLTTDYELTHEIDIDTVGVYPVTVTRGDYSATFDYTVAARVQTRIGDVNLDGDVTAGDARLALRRAAGLEELSDEAFLAADVNADGNVTSADARKILRVSAGLESF